MSALPLPGVLAEIADIAGEGAAIGVARAKGGTRVYIPGPRMLSEDHWLTRAVGSVAAWRIAHSHLGGGAVEIPLGPYAGNRAKVHEAIREGIKTGRSEAAVALAAGVTERTVRRHKSGETGASGLHSDQATLF